ncbi:MAG: PDZ domain-containing protein [Pyrinomonadaceae bacterium]
MHDHADGCGECTRFVAEELELNELFGSLPSVEAPIGFQSRVFSAIGQRRDEKAWFPIRTILIPVAGCLVLALAGYFVFLRTPADLNQVAMADKGEGDVAVSTGSNSDRPAPTPELEIASAPEIKEREKELSAADANTVKHPEAESIADAKKTAGEKGVSRKENPKEGSEIRSIDSIDMGSEAPDVENPPGIEPGARIERSESGPRTRFSATEVLLAIGVSAEWKGSGYLVKTVSENSLAARSGVKTGDLVLSIDGKAVKPGVMSVETADGKSLKIRRGGREMVLALGNRND